MTRLEEADCEQRAKCCRCWLVRARQAGQHEDSFIASNQEMFYIFLIALAIFVVGVQVGIHHGRELAAREECQYDFFLAN